MCKYCMRTWADADYNDSFFKQVKGNIWASLTIDGPQDDEDVATLFFYAADAEEKDTINTHIKIHYCPFCGQKLDLVEVD